MNKFIFIVHVTFPLKCIGQLHGIVFWVELSLLLVDDIFSIVKDNGIGMFGPYSFVANSKTVDDTAVFGAVFF
ncbi:hypothetical protein D3C81_1225760 [compost metagenome]